MITRLSKLKGQNNAKKRELDFQHVTVTLLKKRKKSSQYHSMQPVHMFPTECLQKLLVYHIDYAFPHIMYSYIFEGKKIE